MNGIYESYDDIPEATWEYVEAWFEEEPASSASTKEEKETPTHQKQKAL